MKRAEKKNGFLSKLTPPQNETESFQNKLRLAMYGAITEQDMAEIVKGMVQRAKDGDEKAVRMVFEYLLAGGKTPSQATQINVYPPEKPASNPTRAIRGTGAKIEALASRAMNGEELFHPLDHDLE